MFYGFYLVIHSGFCEAQFPLSASHTDCIPLIKEGHCVLIIEPLIQLSILAPGKKYTRFALKVDTQADWFRDNSMQQDREIKIPENEANPQAHCTLYVL